MNITEHAVRLATMGVALSITPRPNGTVGVTAQRMCDGCGKTTIYTPRNLQDMRIDGVGRDLDYVLQELG